MINLSKNKCVHGQAPLVWLGIAFLLGLSACAQAPKSTNQAENTPLVFPSPPDQPRFYFERTIFSNNDIVGGGNKKSPSMGLVKDFLVGESTTGPTAAVLWKPYAIAVHRGRIFVSEPASRVIKVFDVLEGRYFTIGENNSASLLSPIGIDVDAEGNLYVADGGLRGVQVIMVYDRDGNFLRKLGVPKIRSGDKDADGQPPFFSKLISLAVEKKADINGLQRIYAVDLGGSRSAIPTHRVRVLDAKNGELLFDIGERGSGPGQFNLPRDVVIGKENNIYVVDGGNFRVQVFSPSGKYLREFGQIGKTLGSFARPKEIAADADGNVYIIDTIFANFQIFNAQGQLLMHIGSGSPDVESPARYKLPSGIAVDEDGRVYVVDQLFKKIDIFRPAALSPQDGYSGSKKKSGT